MSQYLDRKEVIELYEKYQPCMANRVYEFGEALRELPIVFGAIGYKAKVKELEDAIAKCEKAEKDFKSRTCKFRSPKNCDFCAFHSECEEHWKEGEDAPKSQEDEGTKKCPICGSDLYEHCYMCCYEGEKVSE